MSHNITVVWRGRKMKKWLIATLITLLFCVSVSSVQAYTNEEYGFSIEPPSGWTADEKLAEETDSVIAFMGPEEAALIAIAVEPTDYTLEQFVSELKEVLPTEYENYKLVSEGERVINKVDAYELVFTCTTYNIDYKSKWAILVKAKKYYGIIYVGTTTKYEKYLPAFEASVETFKIAEKEGCIIATATYGSELSPEVQFLRAFRDNTVLNTFAGKNFMAVFNAWYYSFSPAIASTISSNEALRGVMKVVLYPLMGILHLSSAAFSLFSFSPELGVMIAGLIATSLIGLAYIMPWTLLFSLLMEFKPSKKTIRLTGLVWGGSVIAIALAEAATSSSLMMASTGAFVLATICLTTLAVVRATLKRRSLNFSLRR